MTALSATALTATPSNDRTLLPAERAEFLRRESNLRKNMQAFHAVIEDLVYIKEHRLYREHWRSFAAYLEERWGMSRTHAYRLIDHAATVQVLSAEAESQKAAGGPATIPLPTAPNQTRPLAGLPAPVKVEAWRAAAEGAGGEAPTEAQVKAAVEAVAPRPKPADDVERARAAGIIPPTSEVTVTPPDADPGAGGADGPSDEAEPPDAEWLEALPARHALAEHVRARFDAEAVLFRRATEARLAFAAAFSRLKKAAVREAKGHIGPWTSAVTWALHRNDPSRWQACPDCGGTGRVELIGDCPACKGHGYHV